MWGLDLDRPAAAVVDAAREGGLLVNATAKTVVRLLPPLTITETEVDQAVVPPRCRAGRGCQELTDVLSLIERTPASVHAFPEVLDLRQATPDDVPAIHALVDRHVATDHLLPRASEEIQSHCERFVVATLNGDVVGCAELAPLSPQVAEVRSLVVEATPAAWAWAAGWWTR